MSNKTKRIVAYLAISIALIGIGLHICFNMKYFYIDMPSVLVAGKQGWLALVAQVFQNPRLDFMYNIIIFVSASLIGNTPSVYFGVQFLFFVLTALTLIYFSQLCNAGTKTVMLCAGLLICSSSVAENLYTVGKKEIILSAGIAISLLCLYALVFYEHSKWKKILLYFAYISGIIFAMTLKETSSVVICAVLLLQTYTLIFNRKYSKKAFTGFLGAVIIMIFAQVYKKMFISYSDYTSYEITFKVIWDNIEYYFLYHKDICFAGAIGLAAGAVNFIKDKTNPSKAYLLIINLTGWAYVGGICLWRWPQSYYLYPAVMFFSISLINMAYIIPKMKKALAVIFCVAISLAGTYGILYNYCVAFSHMDLSIIYSDSVDQLAEITKSGDRIILGDTGLFEEPAYQMKNLLVEYLDKNVEIWGGRQNIIDEEFSDETLTLYGYKREQYEEEMELAELKEGDYLVHYINERNFFGPIRGVNPATTKDIISILQKEEYNLSLVDERMIQRKYFGIEDHQLGIHEMQTGYQIWRVDKISSRMTGVTADGWSGKTITIRNYQEDEAMKLYVYDIGSAINQSASNRVDIYVDGSFVKSIEVERGSVIDINELTAGGVDDRHRLDFIVENVFVPAKLLDDNDDDRELGINVIYGK